MIAIRILVSLITGLCFFESFALAKNEISSDLLSLKYSQSLVIDTKTKFEGTKLGGFSGLVIKDQEIHVITDDRGRNGDPRIYKFSLSGRPGKNGDTLFELKLVEKLLLFKKSKKIRVFDFEALMPFKGGWLVSSEGDWNSKPRVSPEVLWVKDKEIKGKVNLPQEYLPKFNGKQIAGVYNNKAFEGMDYDETTGQLYLLSESGLVQKNDGDSVFYLLEYQNQGEQFYLKKQSRLDFTSQLDGSFLYTGATDLIKLSENSFLVLTRSVQTALSLQYTNTIWQIKRKTIDADWEIKTKFQISGAPDTEAPGKSVPQLDVLNQNYEGMSILDWKGKKYIVLVSDDNFNSFEKTVFSFFEIEVK